MPRLALRAPSSAATQSVEYRRYARVHRHQPAADVDPVGRVDVDDQAAVPVALDHLAANLDPGRSAGSSTPGVSKTKRARELGNELFGGE
jgi:hypothetical protein